MFVDGVNSEATRPVNVDVSVLLLPKVELSLTVNEVNTAVVGVVAPIVALLIVPPVMAGVVNAALVAKATTVPLPVVL